MDWFGKVSFEVRLTYLLAVWNGSQIIQHALSKQPWAYQKWNLPTFEPAGQTHKSSKGPITNITSQGFPTLRMLKVPEDSSTLMNFLGELL